MSHFSIEDFGFDIFEDAPKKVEKMSTDSLKREQKELLLSFDEASEKRLLEVEGELQRRKLF